MAAKKTDAKKSPAQEALAAAGRKVGEAKKALKADPENQELKQALEQAEAELAQLKATKPKTVKALKVTCSKDGFWRAGRQWTREPVIVPIDSIDNKQLALITGEPKLTVEHIDVPAEDEE